MNIIEKRKGQLKGLGLITLILGALMLVGGVLMLCLGSGAGMIIGGILLAVLGLVAVVGGIVFTWVSNAVVATHGSIAEGNLGKGTVNMHKCENCGAEVDEGVKICAKCEENLKP